MKEVYPVLFSLGDVPIPSWHVFYLLAALCAYIIFIFFGKKITGISEKQLNSIFILGYVGGYLGARIFSILVDDPEINELTFSTFFSALTRPGAMTMYGGVIGAFLFSSLYVYLKKLPFLQLADAAFLAGILAVGVGRIGCFLNGDDYGKVIAGFTPGMITPWWAVVFPNHQELLPRYPVQIWETLFCFLLCSFLARCLLVKQFTAGQTAWLTVFAYASFRVVVEYFRGDERGWVVENVLSPAQFISIIILVFLIIILLLNVKKLQKTRNSNLVTK